MDAVDRFAAQANSFEQWARAGTDSGAEAARSALLQLARLYLAALELPPSDGPGDTDQAASVRVDDAEYEAVFAHCTRLPLDHYGEVFNPLTVPPEASLLASLADGIADIYRDVVSGLRHYRAGQREQALWDWTFSFQVHWGEHITGAIRALHCWLATHDASGLSAKPWDGDAAG